MYSVIDTVRKGYLSYYSDLYICSNWPSVINQITKGYHYLSFDENRLKMVNLTCGHAWLATVWIISSHQEKDGVEVGKCSVFDFSYCNFITLVMIHNLWSHDHLDDWNLGWDKVKRSILNHFIALLNILSPVWLQVI